MKIDPLRSPASKNIEQVSVVRNGFNHQMNCNSFISIHENSKKESSSCMTFLIKVREIISWPFIKVWEFVTHFFKSGNNDSSSKEKSIDESFSKEEEASIEDPDYESKFFTLLRSNYDSDIYKLITEQPKLSKRMCNKDPYNLAQLAVNFMLNQPEQAARSSYNLNYVRMFNRETFDDSFEAAFTKVIDQTAPLLSEVERDSEKGPKYKKYEEERQKLYHGSLISS